MLRSLSLSEDCTSLDVTYFRDPICQSPLLSTQIPRFKEYGLFPEGESSYFESYHGGCTARDALTFEQDTVVISTFDRDDTSCSKSPIFFTAFTMDRNMMQSGNKGGMESTYADFDFKGSEGTKNILNVAIL
jgi:hypothetical protein